MLDKKAASPCKARKKKNMVRMAEYFKLCVLSNLRADIPGKIAF